MVIYLDPSLEHLKKKIPHLEKREFIFIEESSDFRKMDIAPDSCWVLSRQGDYDWDTFYKCFDLSCAAFVIESHEENLFSYEKILEHPKLFFCDEDCFVSVFEHVESLSLDLAKKQKIKKITKKNDDRFGQLRGELKDRAWESSDILRAAHFEQALLESEWQLLGNEELLAIFSRFLDGCSLEQEDQEFWEADSYYPLWIQGQKYCLRWQKESYRGEGGVLSSIYSLYQDLFSAGEDKRFLEIDWESVFRNLDFPIAVVEKDFTEFVFVNSLFGHLNLLPNRLRGMGDLFSFDHEGKKYKGYRYLVKSYREHYLFMLKEDVAAGIGIQGQNEELGIMASSIAHELNNPVAGIMSALTVFSLEDAILEHFEGELGEMKKSAKRCQGLISTFLGFSRISQGQDKVKGLASDALEQALGLIRFRSMEAGVRLEFTVSKKAEGSLIQVNTSIVGMVIYLILGELITASNYQALIASENVKEIVLRGDIWVLEHAISFSLEKNWNVAQQLSHNKLITHLLQMEGLELQVSDNKIVIHDITV